MDKTTAADIMSTELIVIQEDENIEEALKMLINYKVTGLPVVDKKGKMLGVLSEYDLIKQIAKNKKITSDIFVKKIEFSHPTTTVDSDAPIQEVISKFVELKFRRLPVVDKKNKLVGIITRRDLMRMFYYRAKLT